MFELIDKVMSLFIEGDGDDEFTRGYNFAVEEYREKVKRILSTSKVEPVKNGMTRVDDLIDRQSVVDIAMAYCPDDDGCCSKAFDDIRELLDDIENLPAVNHWIPCSERMPESEREVLVYVKGDFDNSIPFITTAYINSDHDWQSDYDGEVIDSKITHWMPLPEPPEGDSVE